MKLGLDQKIAYFEDRKHSVVKEFESFISILNIKKKDWYNGIFYRYQNPVLTDKHIPVEWRYDIDPDTNPYFMERLEINSVFNSGAIEWNDKILLMPRIESNDVKSFFGIAESENGVDNFAFWEYPTVMPTTKDPETNVYDIRLTKHEDGWVYGTFCAERKDNSKLNDSSAAIASSGLARTKDLIHWERLPDIVSSSPQQRNCVIHPEFVNGKYGVYTRPMDGFLTTGVDGGIGWGECADITNPHLENEFVFDTRKYHTVREVKNGLGPQPLKTKEGWLHSAHGVRRTAAGLRYVLYLFLCDLDEPWKIIRYPGRHFMAPEGSERVGDVSNVLFSNGWVMKENGDVLIYYASSDTRTHVATSHIDILLDYVMNTPEDAGITSECVKQRIELIKKNKGI